LRLRSGDGLRRTVKGAAFTEVRAPAPMPPPPAPPAPPARPPPPLPPSSCGVQKSWLYCDICDIWLWLAPWLNPPAPPHPPPIPPFPSPYEPPPYDWLPPWSAALAWLNPPPPKRFARGIAKADPVDMFDPRLSSSSVRSAGSVESVGGPMD
jgi:hypothetical protein